METLLSLDFITFFSLIL